MNCNVCGLPMNVTDTSRGFTIMKCDRDHDRTKQGAEPMITTPTIIRILAVAFWAVLFFHLWGMPWALVATAAVALSILP
jgi:hypothetical protein